MGGDVGISKGYGDNGRQGDERKEERKFKDAPSPHYRSVDGSAKEIDFYAILIESANGDVRAGHGGTTARGELGKEIAVRGGRCLGAELLARLEHPGVGRAGQLPAACRSDAR